MPTDTAINRLYDEYLPFRLYADHKMGATAQELADEFGLPARWVEERIEAARLCLEMQVRFDFAAVHSAAAERTAAAF